MVESTRSLEDAYKNLNASQLNFVSKTYQAMIDFVKFNRVNRETMLRDLKVDMPYFMVKYKYRISPLPFVISRKTVEEFEGFIQLLVPLIFRVIKEYFKNDEERFFNYLGESQLLLVLVQEMKDIPSDVLLRHDLVVNGNGLKLLEVNAGSNVGGWQHDWVSPAYRSVIESHDEFSNFNLAYRNVTEETFKVILSSISRLRKVASGNSLMFMRPTGDDFQDQCMQKIYRELYSSVAGRLNGELNFFSNFEEVSFSHDGKIIHNNILADAILLPLDEDVNISGGFLMRLLKEYLLGNIVYPDSPLHLLLGNKKILALLHESDVLCGLTNYERKFIEKHIPWTCLLAKKEVEWKGSVLSIKPFLLKNKDKLVIKKSNSFQGRDVFVGKFLSSSVWKRKVEELSGQKDWVVQEYFMPDEEVVLETSGDVTPYNFVWGVFQVGFKYSGAFIRAGNVEVSKGILNSANGAMELIVFEERNKKNRFVI